MNLPITRESAWELVKKYNKDSTSLNHYLESEAIMKALAKKLGKNEESWGMLGLLHDIDWELTRENEKNHLTKAPQILKENGFGEEFIEVIKSHGYGFDCAGLKDQVRTKPIEHALACAETLTGLIHAYALMRGGMNEMKVKGLNKKFKDLSFARKINRDVIKECEELGLSLTEFFELSISAIQKISDQVGL